MGKPTFQGQTAWGEAKPAEGCFSTKFGVGVRGGVRGGQKKKTQNLNPFEPWGKPSDGRGSGEISSGKRTAKSPLLKVALKKATENGFKKRKAIKKKKKKKKRKKRKKEKHVVLQMVGCHWAKTG